MAEVGQLMIGHFSARYNEVDALLTEARLFFENTVEAVEGETVFIGL